MEIIVFFTGIISTFVDFFLLLGTNRITGRQSSLLRIVLASILGGVYNSLCVCPMFSSLSKTFVRVLVLFLISLTAYGWHRWELQKGAVFVLLHMALYGLSLGAGGDIWTSLFASGAILFLCHWGRPHGEQRFVPVELTYGDKKLKIVALRDTGNCLKDPVTGMSVLIVSPIVAQKLVGLTIEQLKDPVMTMGAVPGLRLIPYRTVGKGNGLLLAMRFSKVRIGHWQGSKLVAFAPEGLGNAEYQGLTGGSA